MKFTTTKIASLILTLCIYTACQEKPTGHETFGETISTNGSEIFNKLVNIMGPNTTVANNDSLSFLIIPIDMTCESCRDKSIAKVDSLKNQLAPNKFVIISASDPKEIKAYFKNSNIQITSRNVIIDTSNMALKSDLIYAQPTIYFSHLKSAYKKIKITPVNINKALDTFFDTNS
jgi:hypothetical protein